MTLQNLPNSKYPLQTSAWIKKKFKRWSLPSWHLKHLSSPYQDNQVQTCGQPPIGGCVCGWRGAQETWKSTTYQVQCSQHDVDCVQLWSDQLLTIHFDIYCKAEELQQHAHQLASQNKITYRCQPTQRHTFFASYYRDAAQCLFT